MIDFTVKVDGLSQLEDALDQLPPKLGRRIFNKSLVSGINVIRTAAEKKLLSKASVQHGWLRDSFRVTVKGVSGAADVVDASEATLSVGNRIAWYAKFLEFGTRAHEINAGARLANPSQRKGGKTGALKIGSQFAEHVHVSGLDAEKFSFMRPAFDQAGVTAVATFQSDLEDFISSEYQK